MRDSIQSLRSQIDTLETELNAMLRMPSVHTEKKDPKEWDRLHAAGRKISKE